VAGVMAALRNRGLVTLMLGHFAVDSYAGLLPVLYPLLIGRFHLDLGTVGLVSLAYTGMASVSQPLFGAVADRYGTRFTGGALLWTAVTFGAVGFAPSFPALVAIAALSGLGSGFFHPLGALTVRGLLPDRGRNTAMSVYVTGGTIGLACGPLIGVVVFGLFGARGTAAMLAPVVAIAAFLLTSMRRGARGSLAAGARRQSAPSPVPWSMLVATVGVMMSRNWTVVTLQAFTPTWYHLLGYQPWFYGPLVTTLVLASAAGAVGCGGLADRHGRRAVILGTLLLSIPAVALYVGFPGPAGFAWAIMVGLLAASTAPLTLMLAQELMAGRAGLASGLVMGLAFVTGAIGIPITGAVADHLGLQAALALQVAVVVATIPLALLLPGEDSLRRLRESREDHAAATRAARVPTSTRPASANH
jgi:FSR family fosmidomycin resistance protein-like MFS transporter